MTKRDPESSGRACLRLGPGTGRSSFHRQVFRYGTTGAVGLLVNVSLLVGFVELGGLSATIAPLASLTIALAITLALTDRWVFRVHRTRRISTAIQRTPLYYAVMIGGKSVNFLLYLGLTGIGVPYPVAWVTGAALVFVATFTANRIVWSGRPTGRAGE